MSNAGREATRAMNHKTGLARRIIPILVLVLCFSLFYSLLRSQMTIRNKEQELASVTAELSDQLARNEDLQRTLDDGEDAIIERFAREEGYSKPNERIWVDISGK